MMNMGKHWSAPKKNNDRAWRRIARGEVLWNRRKVRRGGSYSGRHFTEGRYKAYYRSSPRVDMGG
jgi:hypothetical protein